MKRRVPTALLLGLACVADTQADPEDFQAIQGLWKITVHAGNRTSVRWRCYYDGADPWTVLIDPLMPSPTCQRSDGERNSIALGWNLQCGEHSGQGRLLLDSEAHFKASVVLGGKPVLRAEGQRHAACTGPAD